MLYWNILLLNLCLKLYNRNYKHRNNFKTERLSGISSQKQKAIKQYKNPVYKEHDVKGLKIVDYFNGMNRLNRYIKKTKERLKSANKGFVRSEKLNSKLISPFKKTLINVNEVYEFVQQRQREEQSLDQSADNEAIVIHDDHKLDEKQKWTQVMNYMRKNPKILVDALPEPDSLISQPYYPLYGPEIEQQNQPLNYSQEMPM